MRRAVLISLLAGCIPCGSAQQSFTNPHFPATHFGGHRYAEHSSHRYGFAIPWLWDSLYANDVVEYAPPPEHTEFQRILTTEAVPAPPAEPLLIELQGDRYVQLSGGDRSSAKILDIAASTPTSQSSSAPPALPPKPAILIFRDGHRQEVSAYTIAAGVLYAQTDFYSSGSWHRKIDLSSLDLPATITENQSRGAGFQLPTAPNEVIVGP